MVVVSSDRVNYHLKELKVEKMFRLQESDIDAQGSLRMANVTAVDRLMYNGHGSVDSKIASGGALELFDIPAQKVTPRNRRGQRGLFRKGESLISDLKN